MRFLYLLIIFLFFPITALAATTRVEYELPYPGLLPDSPLYVVKQVRDWVLDKLIMDPVKKIEFNILQGDKRVNAGVMLAQKGKIDLAEKTVGESQVYMEKAVTSIVVLKDQGKDVPASVLDRIRLALAKHAEVLQDASLSASITQISGFQEDLMKIK